MIKKIKYIYLTNLSRGGVGVTNEHVKQIR